MGKNTFKSIGAVLAGLVAGLVLSLLTDFVVETTGVLPKGRCTTSGRGSSS